MTQGRFASGRPDEWAGVMNPARPSWTWTVQPTERDAQRVRLVTPAGVVYASHSHYITRSTDWGATWSALLTDETDLPYTIRQLAYVESDGSFLAACTGGYVYKGSPDLSTWTQVLDYGAGEARQPFEDFGFHVHGDIALVTSYGSDMTACTTHLSQDGGDTWSTILTVPASASEDSDPISHMHDVRYDPYEGIIWATSGDDYLGSASARNRLYWSRDLGATWEEWRGFRSAQVIPMPDCVLFASDETGRMSVARHARPVAQASADFTIQERWLAPMETETAAAYHWGSSAAIDRSGAHRAYFGFRHPPTDHATFPSPHAATVWTTTDGIQFDRAYQAPALGGSIGGVFGPDNDGNLAVALTVGAVNYLGKLTPA